MAAASADVEFGRHFGLDAQPRPVPLQVSHVVVAVGTSVPMLSQSVTRAILAVIASTRWPFGTIGAP